MNAYKYLLSICCFSLLSLPIIAQEWSKQDSLNLQRLLKSDQEIRINKDLIKKAEEGISYRKYFLDFDPALPILKRSVVSIKSPLALNLSIRKEKSSYLSTYSLLKINKHITLHSKSNFGESSNNFHISTHVDYKFANKWSLNIYGIQNLDSRRYKGLPSEVIPTAIGSNIVYKVNKSWKIKAGLEYHHNTIRKKKEWIPQVSVSFEW